MKLKEQRNKRKLIITIIVLFFIVFIFFLAFVGKNFYGDWRINNSIVKDNSSIVKISNIKNLNLWNKTLNNLKDNKKRIEIEYDTYSLSLATNELNNKNFISIDVANKKTSTKYWKDKETLEINLSNIENINVIDQIKIDKNKLLNKYDRIDIYGINISTNKCEFLETKELEEDDVSIVNDGKYKVYFLIYIPIEKINTSVDKIEMIKNEKYQLNVSIFPEEATYKIIHIDENASDIVKINQDCLIEAIAPGNQEIELQAENGQIIKKVEVIVKENADVNSVKDSKTNPSENTNTFSVSTSNDSNQDLLISSNFINGVLVVNKKYRLPSNYNPGVNQEALNAFNKMKTVASNNGISLKIVSGFRSYKTQQATYNRNVMRYGEETANRYSAKPRRI